MGIGVAEGMIIRRGLPIVLGVAGVLLLVYGAAFSPHPVTFEEEIAPPPPPEPPPPFISPRPGRPRPPFMKPPPRPPAEPVKVLRTISEREAKLVLEATRGGLTTMDDGRLKRTYSGAPPSGCPT